MIEWNALLDMYMADVASVSLSSCVESTILAVGFCLRLHVRCHGCLILLQLTVGFCIELNSCGGVSQAQLTGSWGDPRWNRRCRFVDL